MEKSKLAQARIRKHWTLKQAADAVEVSLNTFSRWELGRQKPYGESLLRLCKVFDASSEQLGLDTDYTETTPAEHPLVTALLGNDLTMRLLAVAFELQRFEAVQMQVTAILEEYDMNRGDAVSRREALLRLAALPFIASLRPGTSKTSRRTEDIVAQCSAGIAACWELSRSNHESDLAQAFKAATAYSGPLKEIVADGAQHQKAAASLAGQSALLQTILGWHLENLDRAATYGQEALLYSRTAGDMPLQIAAHTQLSWIYYYARQSKKALQAIEEAAYLLASSDELLSPRLRSSVQSTLAIRQAMHGQPQQAIRSLKQAHQDFFKAVPGEDAAFLYVDYERPSLILEDGMTYVNLGRYDTALGSFAQVVDASTLQAKLPVAERVRVEILNNQAIASLKIKNKDMEQTAHLWHAAIQGAKAIKSEQRFREALLAYDIMEAVWPSEKRITELRDLARHW